MDRALKERIIGATVLVFIAVLVVPVFLDGPSTDSEISSKLVTLPGQSEQRTRQQTIVLNRDRKEPVPQAAAAEQPATSPVATAVTTSGKTAPVQRPATEAVKIAASKLPATDPQAAKSQATKSTATKTQAAQPPSRSATGMWAVQMGSFSNKANAERLAVNLRKDGFAAFLSQLKTSSGQLHRVRIGPQKDRNSAESVSAQLNRAGHKGQVVPHP